MLPIAFTLSALRPVAVVSWSAIDWRRQAHVY